MGHGGVILDEVQKIESVTLAVACRWKEFG